MRKDRIAAIDVGTTKVCTIMADVYNKEEIRVIGVGVTPSRGLHKGLVVNLHEARESIRRSVRMAEQMAGRRLESAYVGVTGRHITSINNRGSIAITRSNQVVSPSDLKRVLDVARSVKVPSEQRLLHVIPREYVVDGQGGVKNPVGMHGFRLDVETHIITAAVTSVQNLTKCVHSTGVDVEDLVMEPLASAEAVLTPEEKQDGVLLADIGGGTTDIALFKDNTIYHTAVIPVAGYQVTRDISIGLGVTFEFAEEMKKRYGNVMPVMEEEEGRGKDRDKNIAITGDGHSISYRDLSEIIRMRVEEILRLIMLELPQQDYEKLIPAGLVLTGGGANLPGIAELGEMVTRVPVRVGRPISLAGVSDMLDDPAYATAVGLLLWKMRNQDSTVTPAKDGALRRMLTRMFRLFR
ncbi:MAG: cell division protein FtsA [Dehalococcoidales bacterium]|nr:cell division protein FtsA [Dehalococcoidales bacterium]